MSIVKIRIFRGRQCRNIMPFMFMRKYRVLSDPKRNPSNHSKQALFIVVDSIAFKLWLVSWSPTDSTGRTGDLEASEAHSGLGPGLWRGSGDYSTLCSLWGLGFPVTGLQDSRRCRQRNVAFTAVCRSVRVSLYITFYSRPSFPPHFSGLRTHPGNWKWEPRWIFDLCWL